ncbi:hypothetical protein KSW81_001159 [Nannochloris sp. 'desiccata']|nr:hypothetical protein KSW81_001159 [Chlorella desiccata (nom. nud.)]
MTELTDLFLAPRAPPMFVGHRNGTLAGLKPASDDPGDPSKLYISCNTTNALGEKYNSSAPYSGTIPMYAIIQPHWVVAIDEEDYQWAIVTAGRPYERIWRRQVYPLRCTNFWILVVN